MLALAVLAAGCGGGGGPKTSTLPTTQRLAGPGFSVAVPKGWRPAETARLVTAGPGTGPTMASVTVLSLLKRYRPSLFGPAAAELNRITAALAAKLHGRMRSERTILVAGQRARQYEIAYRRGKTDLVDQITYVLRGKSEYYLLCRWPSGAAEPAACSLLTSSFRLR